MASSQTPLLLKRLRDGPRDEYDFARLQDTIKAISYDDQVFIFTRLRPVEREFYFGEWTPDQDHKGRCDR